jgi:GNAT superfamily N-acetyltransferase
MAMITQILVRELSHLDRAALERHFLALGTGDRRLRFGVSLGDAALRAYVSGIDFERDRAFGVFDDELRLLAAAHLGLARGHAELGVSVLPGHRGRGFGGALLARAQMHARNRGERALFMHCLAENATMMHLARKQGMALCVAAGEADAWLKLEPADASTHFGEVFAQRVAVFDYAFKAHVANARRLAGAFTPGIPLPAPEK